jgi:hypothetical protein
VKKTIFLLSLFFFILILFPNRTFAFSSASDTITTSRPSAYTPLTANVNAGDAVLEVTAGASNFSTFLASDLVKLWGGTIETLSVASASADRTKIYTTGTAGYAHSSGTLATHAVTARHTISFMFSTPAVSGDQLVITFPGAGDNSDTPSATTFAFNGLNGSSGTNLTISGTTCSAWSVVAPSIICTLGGDVDTSTTVTVTIGSSTPQLINPTKINAIGTSDLWKLTLSHLDSVGATKESDGRFAIATIEGIQVTGVVDASITMTITPVNNGTNIYTDNNSCNNAAFSPITTNSGADPTATSVNLGTIGTGVNYVAQKITISTNGSGGYALTATASGRLMNNTSGYAFNNAQGGNLTADNTPSPAIISGGTEAYGISACGTHANSIFWSGANALFGNPSNSSTNSYVYRLASYTDPVTSAITSVVYGVTASGITPAGVYETAINYVATPTF